MFFRNSGSDSSGTTGIAQSSCAHSFLPTPTTGNTALVKKLMRERGDATSKLTNSSPIQVYLKISSYAHGSLVLQVPFLGILCIHFAIFVSWIYSFLEDTLDLLSYSSCSPVDAPRITARPVGRLLQFPPWSSWPRPQTFPKILLLPESHRRFQSLLLVSRPNTWS